MYIHVKHIINILLLTWVLVHIQVILICVVCVCVTRLHVRVMLFFANCVCVTRLHFSTEGVKPSLKIKLSKHCCFIVFYFSFLSFFFLHFVLFDNNPNHVHCIITNFESMSKLLYMSKKICVCLSIIVIEKTN